MNQGPGRNYYQPDQAKAGIILKHMLKTTIEFVEERGPYIDDEAISLAESLRSLLGRKRVLLECR